MPLKVRHARILANMLSDSAREVLRIYSERTSRAVDEAGLNEVIEHKLIRKTTDLISGKEIWVLTPDGKKVAACL